MISGNLMIFILVAISLLTALVTLMNSIFIIGGEQIAVLERRWFGKSLPRGRVVALGNEVGVQARVLGPGLHILVPFLYQIRKFPMLIIGEDEIGMVEAIDGEPVPAGRIFAKSSGDHSLFQDGEIFLRDGGEKGPQINLLPPGTYRINPYLFKVEKSKAITIPSNRIGVVVANDGARLANGELVAMRIEGHNNFQDGNAFLNNQGQRGPQVDILLPGMYRINQKLFSVSICDATVIPSRKIGLVVAETGLSMPASEYVAKSSGEHKNFQDGAAFLTQHGERGPQFDFLKPGTYYINPFMFKITLEDVLFVQRGEVAVIVSNVGKDPSKETEALLEKSDKGIERYVVSENYRGIQREVLGPGMYYLNLIAYTPHIIPTTNITIDWAAVTDSDKSRKNQPRILDPLTIVSKDGFEMTVEVKVIIRILPEQAPNMLARIGTVENLIDDVIHPLIDSSFRNQASSSEAMKFMQDRHIEQQKAEEHVASELARYHVECVSVLICQIKLPERLVDTLTSKVVASQQKDMYDSQQEAEGRRKEMEKTKAQADLQPSLVKAEIDVQIAAQQKQQRIILAEGQCQSTRLEQEGIAAGIEAVGNAEASKVRAVGEATASAYQGQAIALGQESLAWIEIMKQISEGNIKITPDILVSSSANGESSTTNVLSAFMANLMKNSKVAEVS